MNARRHADHGSAAVELALIVPALVVLMLLVAYGGRLVQARGDVDAAARDGARAASLARTAAAADVQARAAAGRALQDHQAPCAHIEVDTAVGGFARGGTVAVTVACAVRLSDLALLAVPGSRTVTGHASAPIDTYRSGP